MRTGKTLGRWNPGAGMHRPGRPKMTLKKLTEKLIAVDAYERNTSILSVRSAMHAASQLTVNLKEAN